MSRLSFTQERSVPARDDTCVANRQHVRPPAALQASAHKRATPPRKQQWDAASTVSTSTLRSMRRGADYDSDEEDEVQNTQPKPAAPRLPAAALAARQQAAAGARPRSNAASSVTSSVSSASRRVGIGRGVGVQSKNADFEQQSLQGIRTVNTVYA